MSVATVTDASGQVLSQQEYDPWGKVRTGGIGETTLNYTGQRVDSTGLVYYGLAQGHSPYYHARYYDPTLARFISPDSIVPGASLGAGGALGTVGMMGQEQSSLLTVDFHEGALLSGLNGDNALVLQKGYWFQLSEQDRRQRAREPWGPQNPQALNRYAYVLDNPIRYTDPTGHGTGDCTSHPGCGGVVVNHSKTQSVRAYGTVKVCRDSGVCWFESKWVTIEPGKSSVDYGMYDVDLLQAGDGQRLYDPGTEFWCLLDCARAAGPGHGSSEVYKVNSGERVDLYDEPLMSDTSRTGLVVYSSPNHNAESPLWWMVYATKDRGWKTCNDKTGDCHTEPYKWK